MPEVSGDFEIHLTVSPYGSGPLAAFAERHGVKASYILLDRGTLPSQPMVTVAPGAPSRRRTRPRSGGSAGSATPSCARCA